MPREQSEHSAQEGKWVLSRHARVYNSTLRSLSNELQTLPNLVLRAPHHWLTSATDSVCTMKMCKYFKPGLQRSQRTNCHIFASKNTVQLAKAPAFPHMTVSDTSLTDWLPVNFIFCNRQVGKLGSCLLKLYSISTSSRLSKVCLCMCVYIHQCMCIRV